MASTEIKVTPKEATTRNCFGFLTIGSCFIFNGTLYVKTNTHEGRAFANIAVIIGFPADTTITLVKRVIIAYEV